MARSVKNLPTHMVIPDVQVRSDVDYTHLKWIANYALEKRPSVIVCLGDFADMPSLSPYDLGKLGAEGKALEMREASHLGIPVYHLPAELHLLRDWLARQ